MTVSTVFRFPGFNPWDHLAREELLLDDLVPGTSALILYINSPCVVMGKHQNPLREVRLAEAARRGVPVIRRVSGGGTVWHDEGNLNWSYLGPKEGYDRAAVSTAVAQALSPLGFSLEVGEKGDLLLGEKKVSGAAYLFRRDRVMHHGTLLCRARLDDLHGVLGPTGTLLEWVGVASRPMAVVNLGIDPEQAVEQFTRQFGSVAGGGHGDAAFEARVAARAQELRSPQWLWGQTPPFTWEGETKQGPVRVSVREGRIDNTSEILGKWFFDPEYFEYIPREAT